MKKSDSQVQEDVMEELVWEPSVDHADIGVSVHDGVVTLSGYVKSYPEKQAAEAAARRVAGVRAIAEDIKVRFSTQPKTADHEIAKRIVDVFTWNVLVPVNDISVKVEHGWVTLGGTVQWAYQRDEARKAAGRINGVIGVTNLISVRTAPVASDVRERILAAFKRQSNLSAEAITVTTEGNAVRLGGKVNRWSERGIAERAAWAAPGVTDVTDDIIVAI
ncbi:BON domain-containing protein [Sphingomonas sp. Sph1(2015)]|uniref:BON domain-containing protein n=1 Tax=Sphingomonas sp. Sph1(2015) TaxID=1628084 RepID=UPI0009FB052F|nr:BON domain-containing protein [Sphingomonas sp. Sph1(2015)]